MKEISFPTTIEMKPNEKMWVLLVRSKTDGQKNKKPLKWRFPVTSSIRHFIFCVTSSQREKLSLHTRHFIQVHYIPCATSYQSHFIPRTLHTEVTSYQCTSYQSHLIPKSSHTRHFIPKSFHTEVTSYQSQISHFIPMHFIPRSLHTNALHTSAFNTSHFLPVTLYQTGITSPLIKDDQRWSVP